MKKIILYLAALAGMSFQPLLLGFVVGDYCNSVGQICLRKSDEKIGLCTLRKNRYVVPVGMGCNIFDADSREVYIQSVLKSLSVTGQEDRRQIESMIANNRYSFIWPYLKAKLDLMKK